MEYNKYNQSYPFARGSQHTPYDRGPPRGHGSNFTRGGRFRSQEENFKFRGSQKWRSRAHYERGNHSFNRHRQEMWVNTEREFDERGREVGHYDSHQMNFDRRRDADYSYNHAQEDYSVSHPALSPLEEKARDFFRIVLSQEGIRSKLIFLETVESPLQTLQGTVDYCQLQMIVDQDTNGEFILKIDNEVVAKGTFPTKQTAKNSLAEQAMEDLRKDCFYIIKKKVYEEVSTKKNEPKVETASQSHFQGSKAHQMMLKMGWGGKGLGVNEQGAEKTVAETLDQNVSRQGLGTDDVFKKIHKLLEDYSKANKISLLRFDPDFTSEERAHIHKIAAKFGLKSKSEGKGEQRRITITKKLNRGDLVYNLLISELENAMYKLIIPSKFVHLWNDDGNYDDDF